MKTLYALILLTVLIVLVSGALDAVPENLQVKTGWITWAFGFDYDSSGETGQLTNHGETTRIDFFGNRGFNFTATARCYGEFLNFSEERTEFNITCPDSTDFSLQVTQYGDTKGLYKDDVFIENLNPVDGYLLVEDTTDAAEHNYYLGPIGGNLNVTYNGVLYYTGCGPAKTCTDCEPADQDGVTGIFNVCNENALSGILINVSLSDACNPGWTIKLGNQTGVVNAITLDTSTTFFMSLDADSCLDAWNYFTCVNIEGTTAEPGCSIRFSEVI